jgi:hypothetical protein
MKLKQRPLNKAEQENLFFIYCRAHNNKLLFLHANPDGKNFNLQHTFINAVLATEQEAALIIKTITKGLEITPGEGYKTLPFYSIVGRK